LFLRCHSRSRPARTSSGRSRRSRRSRCKTLRCRTRGRSLKPTFGSEDSPERRRRIPRS
jgi:hypothetical protein